MVLQSTSIFQGSPRNQQPRFSSYLPKNESNVCRKFIERPRNGARIGWIDEILLRPEGHNNLLPHAIVELLVCPILQVVTGLKGVSNSCHCLKTEGLVEISRSRIVVFKCPGDWLDIGLCPYGQRQTCQEENNAANGLHGLMGWLEEPPSPNPRKRWTGS